VHEDGVPGWRRLHHPTSSDMVSLRADEAFVLQPIGSVVDAPRATVRFISSIDTFLRA
jgi:hypothetical protein